MNPIAIHPALWTGAFGSKALAPALERAAEIGFSHLVVPLRRFEEIDPGRLADVFSQAGLSPINAAGVTPDADPSSADPDIRRRGAQRLTIAVQMARDMGSQQINGVLYGPLGKAASAAEPEAFFHSAETLAVVAEVAQRAGVRLALELVNRYETNLLNTVDQAVSYLAHAAHANLYLHLDTFHMSIEEADPGRALEVALPHLAYFEFDQSHRGRLDQGSLALERYAAALKAGGYEGLVGIEAFSRSPMAPDHANALAIWRDTFDDSDALARDGLAWLQRRLARG